MRILWLAPSGKHRLHGPATLRPCTVIETVKGSNDEHRQWSQQHRIIIAKTFMVSSMNDCEDFRPKKASTIW
jgi:hypothetical protein